MARTATAIAPAMTELRRYQLRVAVFGGVGAISIPIPESIASSAARISPARRYSLPGSLARQRRMIARNAGGTCEGSGAGGSRRIAPVSWKTVAPLNGRLPLLISCSSTPSDQMSLALSGGCPARISGAIYATVPVIRCASGATVVWVASARSRSRRTTSQAEVEDLHSAFRRHHDVCALEIRMNDATFMGVLESVGDLHRVSKD